MKSILVIMIACFWLLLAPMIVGSRGNGILTELHDPDKVYCFNKVEEACAPRSDISGQEIKHSCNAKFAGIGHVLYSLEELANMHVIRSYEYLMISSHFKNYEINRIGFTKLFMKLSDEKWTGAIDIIKYITKRGGAMKFNTTSVAPQVDRQKNAYEVYELAGLAKALDFEKNLAEKTNNIHKLATEISHNKHDAGVMEFLQDLIEKFEDNSRTLAGFVIELSRMANSTSDRNLAFYEFDQYLSKLY